MKLIKSVSGIRGIYNISLFQQDIINFSQAFCKLQSNPKSPILLARDSRESGNEIKEYVIHTLNSMGRKVIDCDIIPTPTAQYIVDKFEIGGGIVITASHNPKEWNGMKFIDDDGVFFDENKCNALFKLAQEENLGNDLNVLKQQVSKYPEAIDIHLKNVLNLHFLDINKIKEKKFKVVLDTINGASCVGFNKLLNQLNCNIVSINDIPNGKFPRDPEPNTKNLSQVSKLVLDSDADIGIVTDPDGDRLVLIDNKGKIIIEENTLALCVDLVLSKTKNIKPLVTNLSTSQIIEDIAKKHGVIVYRTKVGEFHVVKRMKELKSIIGGEGNGGIILPESHFGRDAFVGAIIILDLLASSDSNLHEINNLLPKYHMIKEKINLENEISETTIKQKIKEYFKNEIINEQDGIKIIAENYWVHIRKSNTEPIVRLFVESEDKDISERTLQMIKNILSINA